jgi:hypothetical protein
MAAPEHTDDPPPPRGAAHWLRGVPIALWLPGLAVALGAAAATAHGLYEVARAATVPTAIAVLYPLITDGLALVAYAATARLVGAGRRYAWAVVVLAAGLSGLAQAVYLGGGTDRELTAAVRFGIGYWPAIAAAVVAHLLYLLVAEGNRPAPSPRPDLRTLFQPPRPTPAVATSVRTAETRAAVRPTPPTPRPQPVAQPTPAAPAPTAPAATVAGEHAEWSSDVAVRARAAGVDYDPPVAGESAEERRKRRHRNRTRVNRAEARANGTEAPEEDEDQADD